MRLETCQDSVLNDRNEHLAVLAIKYSSQNAVPGLPTSFLYQRWELFS